MRPELSIRENATGVAVSGITTTVTVEDKVWSRTYANWLSALVHAHLLDLLYDFERIMNEYAEAPAEFEVFAKLDEDFDDELLSDHGFLVEDRALLN